MRTVGRAPARAKALTVMLVPVVALLVACAARLPAHSAARTTAPARVQPPGLNLQLVRMITPSVGWAVAGLSGGNGRGVVRTTDGGRTWRSTEPSAVRRAFAINAVFISARAAWVTVLPGNLTRPVVYRTTDAGRSWQRLGTVGVHASYASAPDILGRLGWITATWDYGMGKESMAIFRTSDGGARWIRVELTAGPHNRRGALPWECGKNDAVFAGQLTGWVTASCFPIGSPPFWVSRNGGRTWRLVGLPTPWQAAWPGVATCQCGLAGPVFISPRKAMIWGEAGPESRLPVVVGIAYLTRDGGRTWKLVRLPGRQQPLSGPGFADPRHGLILGGRLGPSGAPPRRVLLFATSDGGTRWVLRSSSVMLRYGVVLDFVTPAIGFALVPGASYLLRTTDGGVTWSVVPARVG